MVRFLGPFLLNILLLGISPVATVALFSAVGKGPATYVFLHKGRSLSYVLGGIGFFMLLLLYLFDLCLGESAPDKPVLLPQLFPTMLAKVLASIIAGLFILAWLFSLGTFPSAPLLLVQLLLLALVLRMASLAPNSLGSTVDSFVPNTRTDVFSISQVSVLFIHGLWTLFLWLFWVGDNSLGGGAHGWDEKTRSKLEDQGINDERFGSSKRNVMLYIWMAPVISSMGLWTLAVVVMFVVSLQRRLKRRPVGSGGQPTADACGTTGSTAGSTTGSTDSIGGQLPTQELTPDEWAKMGTLLFMIKLLTAALVVVCACLWITASIVGSSLSLAYTVQAFTVVFAGFLVVYIYLALSGEARDLIKRGAGKSPLMRSARGFLYSNWARATLLSLVFVPLPIYLFVSFLNQQVRRLRARTRPRTPQVAAEPVKVPPKNDTIVEPKTTASWLHGYVTPRVEQQMGQLMGWDLTKVHLKVQLLCMMAVSLQVIGGMGTNIFLAWVNSQLKQAGFLTLTAFFLLVGTGMFMIPIVPGIAVYLFGGVLIPAGYVRHCGHPGDYTQSTFWMGFLIATGLNFTLKIVAIILQQKGIGEPMSTNLWVLQTVGANTPQMKAIELLLRRPGLTIQKITILCGGPDWPTSVLTGILRLSLPQMLLGSLPVLSNVIFVTSAGSFRLKQSESATWSAASSVALTVASVWTVLQMALAAYYIQDTWERYHDDLKKPRREHIELDWLDHVAAKQQAEKDKVMDWGSLPLLAKIAIFLGSALMLLSSFYMIMLQSRCWSSFDVTDDISKLGLHFIQVEGWISIGVFAFSCLLYFSVQMWSNLITRKQCQQIARDLAPVKEDWQENRLGQCPAQPPQTGNFDSYQEFLKLQRQFEACQKEVRKLRSEREDVKQEVLKLRSEREDDKQELRALKQQLGLESVLPADRGRAGHHDNSSDEAEHRAT